MKLSKRGKSRVNWRICAICKKEAGGETRMFHVCNCPSSYVHYKCQTEKMMTSGKISCQTCKGTFSGVAYTYRNKNFLQYIWEESGAGSSLVSTVSMVLSMCLAVTTLYRAVFYESETILGEVAAFRFALPKREVLLTNMSIIMMLHVKLFLPLLSIYFTGKNVKKFIADYLTWHRENFNIAILPQPSGSSFGGSSSHHETHGTKEPRSRDGKYGMAYTKL